MNCRTCGNYQDSERLSVKKTPFFVCSRLTAEILRSESRGGYQERSERLDVITQ